MKTIQFDFSNIHSLPTFYRKFQKELDLDKKYANNLDGLWDSLTGMIDLPIKIEFCNLTLEQLDQFENLITTFEEAQEELDGELDFSYFINS